MYQSPDRIEVVENGFWCAVERGARVNARRSLLCQRVGSGRRGMPQTVDRPPLDPVQIAPSLCIAQIRPLTAHEYSIRPRCNRHQTVWRDPVSLHSISSYGETKRPRFLPWPSPDGHLGVESAATRNLSQAPLERARRARASALRRRRQCVAAAAQACCHHAVSSRCVAFFLPDVPAH